MRLPLARTLKRLIKVTLISLFISLVFIIGVRLGYVKGFYDFAIILNEKKCEEFYKQFPQGECKMLEEPNLFEASFGNILE